VGSGVVSGSDVGVSTIGSVVVEGSTIGEVVGSVVVAVVVAGSVVREAALVARARHRTPSPRAAAASRCR
jgi:uncharacterized protein (DUF2062 family)